MLTLWQINKQKTLKYEPIHKKHDGNRRLRHGAPDHGGDT